MQESIGQFTMSNNSTQSVSSPLAINIAISPTGQYNMSLYVQSERRIDSNNGPYFQLASALWVTWVRTVTAINFFLYL